MKMLIIFLIFCSTGCGLTYRQYNMPITVNYPEGAKTYKYNQGEPIKDEPFPGFTTYISVEVEILAEVPKKVDVESSMEGTASIPLPMLP